MKLTDKNAVITISGSVEHVISSYLKVFLAHQRLTGKQLDVTAALVKRYTGYTSDGVVEPYASQLLFSTETRKEIYSELGVTAPHLNNTFNSLCNKGILAKEGSKYLMNPNIVPTSVLTFKFTVYDKPRQTGDGSSQKIKPADSGSEESSDVPVLLSEESDGIRDI